MIKFLDSAGVAYLWGKVKALVEGFANYTHPTTSGNRHIPQGGASGQVLKWSADGTAEWGKENGGGMVIQGSAYATVEALAAGVTNPAVGDQFNVGEAPPYRVYRWTGQGWEDQGPGLQGPAGADGKDAPPTVYVGENAPVNGETVWVDTDEQDTGLTGADIPVSATEETSIKAAIGELQPKKRVFKDVIVPVDAWQSTPESDASQLDAGYSVCAKVMLAGATSSMYPDVTFAPLDIHTGNFSGCVESVADGVKIYARTAPADVMSLPTVTLWP